MSPASADSRAAGVRRGTGWQPGWLRLALCAAACPLFGCSVPLNPEECNTLLDHYVALLVSSDRPGTSDMELVRLKAAAREKAARDPAFLRCKSEVPRRKFDCAMQASSADKLEQCML